MFEPYLSFARLDFAPHLAALCLAYALALPVGWNREREERSAGLRTFPLVAVSCCGFVQAAEARYADPGVMGHVLQGLIAGIGFIGGGAILKLAQSVKGTATAASLWATGAVGTAVGLGAHDVALVISAMTVLSLVVLPQFKPEPQSDIPGRDGARGEDKDEKSKEVH